jgi:hypothetical protein
MRNRRLFLGLLPLSILLGAFGLGAAACGSSSSGGSAGDCYDYTSFVGTTPTVSFKTQVLPIFQMSCALSTSCHGCDPTATPGCTTGGISPFLGTPTMDGSMSPAQIAAVISQVTGSATTQVSTVDPPAKVGNPDMKIVVPGSPQTSFMMYKLDGDPTATDPNMEVTCATLTCTADNSCGLAMPSGGPQLPSTDRDIIRRWIAQGAMNN